MKENVAVASKAVVILSGGMDSTTVLYDVVRTFGSNNVDAISFHYGQNHSKELGLAKKTCEKLGVAHKLVDVSFLGKELLFASTLVSGAEAIPEGHYAEENMKSTVVPNRNMILISLAAGFAISIGAKHLYYGAHAGDHAIYPDCRPEFVKAMKSVLKLADWSEVELHAPYLEKDKGDIAILGKELGVDYSLTWTCYKGEEEACGVCGSCTERLEAFEKAEAVDPIKYKNNVNIKGVE